jgi:hypothetical protein
MASLKSQLDKATRDLNRAESTLKSREADTKDTRYGKFDENLLLVKKHSLMIKSEAGKKYNVAKKYYDNILAAYNKELENKKITGQQDGVSEAVQAAKLGYNCRTIKVSKKARCFR